MTPARPPADRAVLIPLIAGALMLFYEEHAATVHRAIVGRVAARRRGRAHRHGDRRDATPTIGLYLLGDWPPPFAIVLVLDRLSALMLL